MKHIDTIPYENVDFVWIEDHWDVHWKGLCNHPEHGLCRFKTFEDRQYGVWCPHHDGNGDNMACLCPVPYENMFCDIYSLTKWERFKAKMHQTFFEVCVGKHWTYSWGHLTELPARSPSHPLFKLYYGRRKHA